MAMQERVGLHTSAMQVTRLRNRRSALSPPGDRRTGWVDVGFVPATRTVFGRDRVWVPRAPTTGQQVGEHASPTAQLPTLRSCLNICAHRAE